MDLDVHPTSKTLLAKLAQEQGTDEWQAAWERFVMQYGPPIVSLCRQYGVGKSDVQDVSQQVLLRLRSALVRFECRRWLKVVLEQALQHLIVELEATRVDRDAGLIRQALVSTGRAGSPTTAGSSEAKAVPTTRARQVMAELTPDEEDRFAEQWWAAGAAIWGDSRPSFPEFFGPVLTRCFLKWGLDVALAGRAAQALQEQIEPVLSALDEGSLPRFRGWLTVVVRNAARDCLKEIKRMVPTFGTLAPDGEICLEGDAAAFVKELELREIRVEAERRCQGQVSDRHWTYYCHMVHDDWTAAQVARQFETTTGSVYMAVKRVKDKVIEEMRRLDAPAAFEIEREDT